MKPSGSCHEVEQIICEAVWVRYRNVARMLVLSRFREDARALASDLPAPSGLWKA